MGKTCPITATVVVLYTRVRSLADINESWSRMLDKLVVEELEPNLVTCFDCVGGGRARLSSLIATKVVGVHELAGVRGVVGVGVLPRVGISRPKIR